MGSRSAKRSSESEETIATEEEAKEPACKRKRMDRGMEYIKAAKNRKKVVVGGGYNLSLR